jgi:prepilin-type processing-associated H-X9-DG protein
MPKFHNTIKINASPDRAWAILGDLAGVDRWIPGCTDVKVEGTNKRICTFADGHVQHEEIKDYSSEERSYRYAIEGIPGIKNNRGSTASDGGLCLQCL